AITAPNAALDVGGNWVSYGTATMTGSTVSWRAVSGTQIVIAGGTFDNLAVNNAGAAVQLSTYVLVTGSVSVVAGTLELAGSTLEVRGSWTESPGAVVLGGT